MKRVLLILLLASTTAIKAQQSYFISSGFSVSRYYGSNLITTDQNSVSNIFYLAGVEFGDRSKFILGAGSIVKGTQYNLRSPDGDKTIQKRKDHYLSFPFLYGYQIGNKYFIIPGGGLFFGLLANSRSEILEYKDNKVVNKFETKGSSIDKIDFGLSFRTKLGLKIGKRYTIGTIHNLDVGMNNLYKTSFSLNPKSLSHYHGIFFGLSIENSSE